MHNVIEMFTRKDRLLKETGSPAKDALVGVVLQNPHLAILDIGYSIVRRDYIDMEQIKIVSGGESGHDPLYSGFVGKGFLTAAIHGEIFQSPPSYLIKNLLKEISFKQDVGILVVIQNNPGDNLNFGIAIEQAQSEGIKVMLLTVTDDCSDLMPSNKTDQPRGLTGVVLVQKIASALAEEEKKTLAQIHAYCSEVQKNLSTVLFTVTESMSVAESTCICRKHGLVYEGEVGGGIHGEPGSVRFSLKSVEDLVSKLLQEISKNVVFDKTTPIVVLINNLRISKIEESIFIGELLSQLFRIEVKVSRIYTGTFMSSLEAKGFTVTILKANDEVLKYLDYPTNAPVWNWNVTKLDPSLEQVLKPRIRLFRYPRLELKGPKLTPKQSNVLILVIKFACDALISCERQLNVMDAEYGDGDTGSRIRVAAEEILEGLNDEGLNVECLYVFLKQLSRVAEKIGGTLGALYSIVFEAAANHMSTLKDNAEIDCSLWLSCLFNVVNSLRSHTKTEEATSNMITPLSECATKTEEILSTQSISGIEAFSYGVEAAEKSLELTRLPGKKYPDPGAHAVHIWMRAVLEGVKFRCQY